MRNLKLLRSLSHITIPLIDDGNIPVVAGGDTAAGRFLC